VAQSGIKTAALQALSLGWEWGAAQGLYHQKTNVEVWRGPASKPPRHRR